MPDTFELSDDAGDKLQACLNHASPDRDGRLGRFYIGACARWYATLQPSDRVVVDAVITASSLTDERPALRLAASLPPAPKFPLP